MIYLPYLIANMATKTVNSSSMEIYIMISLYAARQFKDLVFVLIGMKYTLVYTIMIRGLMSLFSTD